MTSSAIKTENSITDERGNVRIEAFGLTLSLTKAGGSVDSDGRPFTWPDNIKLSLPSGERLKVNALQLSALREMLNHPEVAAELNRRKDAEKAKMRAALEALEVCVRSDNYVRSGSISTPHP